MKQAIGAAAVRLATVAAARALSVTPLAVSQLHLDLVTSRLLRRHPEIVRRLGWTQERRALILPSDLPVAFLARCTSERLTIKVARKSRLPDSDATISGPIAAIIDMATGEDDGDALFFSRVVKIEGDTEVAVTLRNAIDNAGIDLLTEFLPRAVLKAPLISSGVKRARRIIGDFAPDYSQPIDGNAW